MAKNKKFISRLLYVLGVLVISSATTFVLVWINDAMEVRYQAVGTVSDSNGNPLEKVEASLLLAPPSTEQAEFDKIFLHNSKTLEHKSNTQGDASKRLNIGISDTKGVFLTRASGRTGAARAIRFGLDTAGKPPFETAWLVLRKKGYKDTVITVSIMNWPTAPKDWGTIANRLPNAEMKTN